MPNHPPLNKIGGVKITEGTETSNYLQEEKTTVIPLVAASERGTAQTDGYVKACRRCSVGVVGFYLTCLQIGREVTKRIPS
jgi:hypothetical protein